MNSNPSAAFRRPENLALGFFLGFTVFAVMGYWVFALNPQNLPQTEWAVRIYQVSFPWFARIQIIVAGLVLAVAFFRHAGARWLVALATVYALSFTSEHVGTGYGIPFSGYEYTGLLGARLLDRVPLVIPLSWFLMSAPAWIIARRTFPGRERTLPRLLQATFLLVLWDLALDPAMSYLTTYWLWENTGAYYGMPWVNLAGWAFTGIVLMAALEFLDRRIDWAGSLPVNWAVGYYLVTILMPLGMLVAYGAWVAVLATVGALAVAYGIHRTFGAAAAAEAPRALGGTEEPAMAAETIS